MRLLRAQITIRLICGHTSPMSMRTHTKEQNIREGRRMLVQLCGCDHGYDLIAWHKELCETKAGGYRWGKRPGIPKNIQNAMDDPTWRETVAEIERVDAERKAKRKKNRTAR